MVIPLSLFEEYLYSSNHRSGSAVYLYSASGSGEAEESLNFGAGQVKLPYTYCNFNPEHLNRLSKCSTKPVLENPRTFLSHTKGVLTTVTADYAQTHWNKLCLFPSLPLLPVSDSLLQGIIKVLASSLSFRHIFVPPTFLFFFFFFLLPSNWVIILFTLEFCPQEVFVFPPAGVFLRAHYSFLLVV